MIGIGIDIIEIERIEKALSKQSNFLSKLFTDYEIEYYKNKGNKAETIAGIFAAKEAVSKVLGKGISGFSWQDIEVKHTQEGGPVIVLKNGALDLARSQGIDRVLVSISHCKTYAVANAAGVKQEK